MSGSPTPRALHKLLSAILGEASDQEPAEDDGMLLFTLLSPSAMNQVQLILLDAADFSEVAKIAFRASGTVTEGFHGVFVPDSDSEDRNA